MRPTPGAAATSSTKVYPQGGQEPHLPQAVAAMPAAFHKGAAGDDGNTAGWLQKCASVRLVLGRAQARASKARDSPSVSLLPLLLITITIHITITIITIRISITITSN